MHFQNEPIVSYFNWLFTESYNANTRFFPRTVIRYSGFLYFPSLFVYFISHEA